MVSAEQIAKLKYLIARSKDGGLLVKQIMYFLLDKSEQLTKEVCVTLSHDRYGYRGHEIFKSAEDLSNICAGNGTTYFDEILMVTGSGFRFDSECGYFDHKGEFINGGDHDYLANIQDQHPKIFEASYPSICNVRYTFWLSQEPCSRKAQRFNECRAGLQAIDISSASEHNDIMRIAVAN